MEWAGQTLENSGGTFRCEVVDERVGQIIESLVLSEDWLKEVLERNSLKDEVARAKAQRERTQEKLRRLGKAFVNGLVYEFELASLVVLEADASHEVHTYFAFIPIASPKSS